MGRLSQLRMNSIARNTGWMAIGQGMNFFLQAGYFLLVARLLGTTEYGVFAGAFALVNLVMPYSALGFPMIFMRYVSADRNTARWNWGNLVAVIAVMTLLIAGILSVASAKLLGLDRIGLVVILVLSSCGMSQVVNAASTVFQTYELLKATAALQVLSNLLRVVAIAALMVWMGHATAFQCAIAILGSSTFACLIAIVLVHGRIGGMHFSGRALRQRLWEGVGFSFAGSTQSAYNDIDKLMLSHYGMNAANGIYTMAYRIVDFATTPVTAIDSAVLPRYFSLSMSGFASVKKLASKIVPTAILAGLAATAFTLLGSPLIVPLIGHGFAETLLVIRWLCWLPPLRGVHQLAGGVLTATGRQSLRTAAQCSVAMMNLVLNLLWIPAHGWRGAAWASLIADGVLGVLNVSLVFIVIPRVTRSMHQSLCEEQLQ